MAMGPHAIKREAPGCQLREDRFEATLFKPRIRAMPVKGGIRVTERPGTLMHHIPLAAATL